MNRAAILIAEANLTALDAPSILASARGRRTRRVRAVIGGIARLCLLVSVLCVGHPTRGHAQRIAAAGADIVFEASITDLQAAMTAGRVTSVALVDAYLARIAAYDHSGPALNALLRLNPAARAEAAARDAERKAGRVRGPLHGIPIILKDNIGTADQPTTGGSIALAGFVPAQDAFIVRKLRDAGAIILAKSNLHELASGITTISSLGGQTCNPYDPLRNPGGSSGGSGAAVAASFAAIAYGTDTCGSIRIPSASNNLFGLRPTKGLTSIDGIIPLAHTQDVVGPLARTVMDLAIGLDAIVAPDPADTATSVLTGRPLPQFVTALDTTALRGARIGVLTSYLAPQPEDVEASVIIRAALARMQAQGAQIIDVTIPSLDSLVGRAGVIEFEFKYDFQDFMVRTPNAPVSSVAQILERGLYDVAIEPSLRRRDATGTRDSEAYRTALAFRAKTRDVVVGLLDAIRLDAIAYPTVRRKPALIGQTQPGANCQLSAVTGLPALSMPAGFTADSLPIGIELIGRPLADPRLLAFAYDYEQAAHPRRPPRTTPALIGGRAPVPVAIAVRISGRGLTARGDFRYDAIGRVLEYSVRVSGVPASHIYSIGLTRGSTDQAGPVVIPLSGPGVSEVRGTLALSDALRAQLVAGALSLTVYSSDRPNGEDRAALKPPG